MATKVTGRDTSRREGAGTACKAHRGLPGSNTPKYPGQVNLTVLGVLTGSRKEKCIRGGRKEDGESGETFSRKKKKLLVIILGAYGRHFVSHTQV